MIRKSAILTAGLLLLAAACADEQPLAPESKVQASATELGVCQNLQVPAGNEFALRVYAEGVQIYHWSGTSWVFAGPSAVLYADRNKKAVVGTHYAGPTWESTSGSKIVARVFDRCTPDANSIPWLLLEKVTTEKPGVFKNVTFIQRVNTVGGNAPAQPGATIGEEARVPYTTDYVFYQPQ
jgi:hypothetical protein